MSLFLRARPVRFAVLLALLAVLASCGLVVSFGSYDLSTPADPLYGVRGTVDGVGTEDVSVFLNGGQMTIMGDGPFAFAKTLRDHTGFVVSDPTAPRHMCTVDGGTGTISGADATGVVIHCVPSRDATLKSLSTTAGSLAQTFDGAIFEYNVRAALNVGGIFGQQTITVTAEVNDPGATIVIAGADVPSRKPSAPIRILPVSTPVEIVVTAADRTTTQRYGLMIYESPVDYIKASNTRGGAPGGFGYSIALSGDTLAVGTYSETSAAKGVNGNDADTSLKGAGAVYVFRRVDGRWSQQAYLKASNPRQDLYFGWAVALSGDTLAVSAVREASGSPGVNGNQADTSRPGAGAVYVFTRNGVVWSQQAYIKASNPQISGNFGTCLALEADTLAVGAYSEASAATGVNGDQTNSDADGSGAVYVFTRTSGSWSQQAFVKASNTRANAYFGVSVALDGDTMAVGSESESSSAVGVNGNQADTQGTNSGAAYVFTRKATQWSQQAYIKASNTLLNQQQGAYFGASVALAGNTLAVGAWGERSRATGVGADLASQMDTSTPNAGAAYVFTRTGAQWSQQAYIKASNTAEYSSFGISVALSGDTLAVGASSEPSGERGVNSQPDGTAMGSGAAYVFTRTAAKWAQRAFVKASNTRPYALFGRAVALSADTLVVGSANESSRATGVNGSQTDNTAPGAGAVYVYR